MSMRASTLYLAATSALVCGVAGLALHAFIMVGGAGSQLARKSALVRRLSLTDLCLFTEANYTRPPSMTDLATPFQDSPMSLEHFPSGALLQPPGHLSRKEGAP